MVTPVNHEMFSKTQSSRHVMFCCRTTDTSNVVITLNCANNASWLRWTVERCGLGFGPACTVKHYDSLVSWPENVGRPVSTAGHLGRMQTLMSTYILMTRRSTTRKAVIRDKPRTDVLRYLLQLMELETYAINELQTSTADIRRAFLRIPSLVRWGQPISLTILPVCSVT